MIVVEVRGLEVFGNHGAYEEERARGQTFLYDIWLGVSDAAQSDRLEDTVDYDAVARVVRDVSEGRRFNLLEALAGAVADAVVRRLDVESVRVRVRKRTVAPAGLPVSWTAATVERP
jgi:7,8-dihydroneopterin aldolase/epimerase/oxygenase